MTLCGSQWRIFLLVFVLLFNLSCKISSDGGNADKSLNSAGTSSGAQAANTSNQDTRSGETSSDSQVSPADSAADNSSNSADTGVSEQPADDSNQDTGAPPDGDMPEQQECTRYVSVSGNNSNSGLTYPSKSRRRGPSGFGYMCCGWHLQGKSRGKKIQPYVPGPAPAGSHCRRWVRSSRQRHPDPGIQDNHIGYFGLARPLPGFHKGRPSFGNGQLLL